MAYTNIDDPSAYFQTALYAGNGTGQTITNDGNSDLKPDFLWFKNRSETVSHTLWDSTRGITKFLVSDSTASEYTNVSGYELTSFNTDGFGLGAHNNAGINQSSSYNYVGWQWKANGGTTASNSDGSITSTVQVNQDAGFSIVTYTGTGSTATVGHGLGVAPSVVLVKSRNEANYWVMYHHNSSSTPQSNYLLLDNNGAMGTFNNYWSSSAPSSTVFGIIGGGYSHNKSNINYVAYCFAEKQGYSKFGKYVGNGNTNGTFIYTGFKPAWVMVKQSNTSRSWQIFDNKRDGYNKDYMPRLQADNNSAEAASAGASMDFVSNGFKVRTDQTGANQSGGTYIYMAFAENPFTTSTGVPCTAR